MGMNGSMGMDGTAAGTGAGGGGTAGTAGAAGTTGGGWDTAQREGERLALLAASVGALLEGPLPPPAALGSHRSATLSHAHAHAHANNGISSDSNIYTSINTAINASSSRTKHPPDTFSTHTHEAYPPNDPADTTNTTNTLPGLMDINDPEGYTDPYLGTVYGPHEPYGLHCTEQEGGWARLERLQVCVCIYICGCLFIFICSYSSPSHT